MLPLALLVEANAAGRVLPEPELDREFVKRMGDEALRAVQRLCPWNPCNAIVRQGFSLLKKISKFNEGGLVPKALPIKWIVVRQVGPPL